MANFKQDNVKRFIENISKEVADNAYNGGGEDSPKLYITKASGTITVSVGSQVLQPVGTEEFDGTTCDVYTLNKGDSITIDVKVNSSPSGLVISDIVWYAEGHFAHHEWVNQDTEYDFDINNIDSNCYVRIDIVR